MKLGLPLKLTIFVILLFAVVIATCLLWTPVKIRYYVSKLRSDDPEERVVGVDKLIATDGKGKEALEKELAGSNDAVNLLMEYWDRVDTYSIKSTRVLFKEATKELHRLESIARLQEKELCRFESMIRLTESVIRIPSSVKFKGYTPLHAAASNGYRDVAALFMAKGAEVDAKSTLGYTPLHFAVIMGYKDVIQLLIDNGANVNSIIYTDMDNNEITALDMAIRNGDRNIFALLRAHGGKMGKEIREQRNKQTCK